MVLLYGDVTPPSSAIRLRCLYIFPGSLILFLIFFPRSPALPARENELQYSWRTAVSVALICLVHGVATIIVSVTLALSLPQYLSTWANILGITAAILAGIQYFPQIWTTYNLGHVGSLSIPMMLIQTPGSFLWSASLAARLGTQGWSSWGVFLVTGCLQGCLLSLGIYFEVKARGSKQVTENDVSFCPLSRRRHTNMIKPNATRVVGYLQGPRADAETDDEGNANVEDGPTARTPLLRDGLRSSRARLSGR